MVRILIGLNTVKYNVINLSIMAVHKVVANINHLDLQAYKVLDCFTRAVYATRLSRITED